MVNSTNLVANESHTGIVQYTASSLVDHAPPYPTLHSCKRWQVMNGTVVDARKVIHTEFKHFADALKFALSLD